MERADFKRRRLIQAAGGGLAALALARPGLAPAQSLVPATLVVMLLDRGSMAADPAAREMAIAAFANRNVPIGLARTARADDDVADNAPGPEPALWHDTAVTLPRYFQARALSDARATLVAGLGEQMPPHVIAAPDPLRAMALSGLSPAGIRCAYLVPEASGPAWIESHPARVVAARGGHLARIGADASAQAATAAALTYLAEATGDPKQTHATLFIDLAGPAEAVGTLAEALAAEVAQRNERGHLLPLAPGEIGVRHALNFERLVGLRLDPPPGAPANEAALTLLAEALTNAGIPFSLTRDDPDSLGQADCLRLDPARLRELGVPEAARGWRCAVVAPAAPETAPILASAGIEAASGAAPAGFRGIDGHGLLHLGREFFASRAEDVDALPSRIGLCEDVVLTIDTGALALPVRRNAMFTALRRLYSVPGTRIVDLAEFTRLMGAGDEVAATLRRTRAMAPEIEARPPAPLAPETRAALMADARRAWRYFEAVTDEATGMPDTTVAFKADGAPGSRFKMLTQWDSGSAILGWISAFRLGLIAPERFDAWRIKVVAALAATTLPSPRLPRAIFYADAPWRGAADFNICDTGRLLVALKALERMSPPGDTAVRDLVTGWDLGAVILDGVPHSIDRGRFVLGPDSHCTGYIKRALALWGIEALSQYDVYNLGETETDAAMHLLNEVAAIGTLGAEPLLQEALELGSDAPGKVLRDVLMAEQLIEWRASGQLVAPSEGPMDRPPWFTYQGLRLDRTGAGRWDVMSLAPGGDTPTDTFRAEARMLTCKAPYLWAAAHPHDYSDRLVAHVRAHGQMVSGFVSGIYLASDTPTVNYGDVNTNGVILQAIAAKLGVPARP